MTFAIPEMKTEKAKSLVAVQFAAVASLTSILVILEKRELLRVGIWSTVANVSGALLMIACAYSVVLVILLYVKRQVRYGTLALAILAAWLLFSSAGLDQSPPEFDPPAVRR